jgi:hypothetical protein
MKKKGMNENTKRDTIPVILKTFATKDKIDEKRRVRKKESNRNTPKIIKAHNSYK